MLTHSTPSTSIFLEALKRVASCHSLLTVASLREIADVFVGVTPTKIESVSALNPNNRLELKSLGDLPVADDSKALCTKDVLVSRFRNQACMAGVTDDRQKRFALHDVLVARPKTNYPSRTLVFLIRTLEAQVWLNNQPRHRTEGLLAASLAEMPVILGPVHLVEAIGDHLANGGTLLNVDRVFADELRRDPTIDFFVECYAKGGIHNGNNAARALMLLKDWMAGWKRSHRGAIPAGRYQRWWETVDRHLAGLFAWPGDIDEMRLIRQLLWARSFRAEQQWLRQTAARWAFRKYWEPRRGKNDRDDSIAHRIEYFSLQLLQNLETASSTSIEALAKKVTSDLREPTLFELN